MPNPETKICPFCAEEIKAAARVCRYCGRDLDGSTNQSSTQAKDISNPRHGKTMQAAGCFVAILALLSFCSYATIPDATTEQERSAFMALLFLVGGLGLWAMGRAITWWHWQ